MANGISLAAAGLAGLGGILRLGAINQSEDFNQQVNRRNRGLLRLQLGDITRQTEERVAEIRKAKGLAQGAQRAAAVGQGVVTDVGTPREFQDDAEIAALEAERNVRFAGMLAAFGVKNELVNLEIQGDLDAQRADTQRAGSILGSVTSVLDVFK